MGQRMCNLDRKFNPAVEMCKRGGFSIITKTMYKCQLLPGEVVQSQSEFTVSNFKNWRVSRRPANRGIAVVAGGVHVLIRRNRSTFRTWRSDSQGRLTGI